MGSLESHFLMVTWEEGVNSEIAQPKRTHTIITLSWLVNALVALPVYITTEYVVAERPRNTAMYTSIKCYVYVYNHACSNIENVGVAWGRG